MTFCSKIKLSNKNLTKQENGGFPMDNFHQIRIE